MTTGTGAGIARSLASRLDDGYPALEVVPVDDRSDDDTPPDTDPGAQQGALAGRRILVAEGAVLNGNVRMGGENGAAAAPARAATPSSGEDSHGGVTLDQ